MATSANSANRRNSLYFATAVACCIGATAQSQTDPVITKWYTIHSSQIAQVVEVVGGTPVTTWPSVGLPNMGGGQATPANSDIQMVRYSASWTYINANGLASHNMGPWYISPGVVFGNWPSSQNYLIRIPRTPVIPGVRDTVGLGNIGLWVNGVGMFSGLDAFSYRNATGTDRPNMGMAPLGDKVWNRSAIAAEVATFDPAYAHQPGNGQYHYHANPLGLRYNLGDHVDYNSGTGVYTEAVTAPAHSPILGWAWDGHPVYGPYGYSDPNDTGSAITRMRSGYTLRNGANGTVNLSSTGRHTLPVWAATMRGVSATLVSGQYGPNVTGSFPLGWYAEDYEYMGDVGGVLGTNFDLDVYNGRTCKTPEYPGGTYAYFTTIDAAGAPIYPFVVGAQYHADATGGSVASVAESTTTYYFNGGPPAAIEGWAAY